MIKKARKTYREFLQMIIKYKIYQIQNFEHYRDEPAGDVIDLGKLMLTGYEDELEILLELKSLELIEK